MMEACEHSIVDYLALSSMTKSLPFQPDRVSLRDRIILSLPDEPKSNCVCVFEKRNPPTPG